MAILQGQYNFKQDIITGEKGEDVIIQHLNSLGFALLNKNKDYRYDYKMKYGDKIITYEQKTDIYPRDTGNLVVEFESRGKPSGISVTESDYFLTYFPHFKEVWNIRTSDLKSLIGYLQPEIRANSGDKNSNTKLYMLKKSRVRNFFKVHKIDI